MRFLEVPDSSHGYPNWCSHGFSQPLQLNARGVTWNRQLFLCEIWGSHIDNSLLGYHVNWWIGTDVLKERLASIFRLNYLSWRWKKKVFMKHGYRYTKLHGVMFRKLWYSAVCFYILPQSTCHFLLHAISANQLTVLLSKAWNTDLEHVIWYNWSYC
jgi:hypothetical protein